MKKSTTRRSRSTVNALPLTAVFAGVDYHKKFSVVSLGDEQGKLLGQFKLHNDKEDEVRKFFARYPGLICAIENCRGKDWFIGLLKELGCKVHVSNTYAVKLIAESRCKTDKIDSRILMELLSKDFLPTVYQPTEAEVELRERLRWRTALMRSRTQYKNRAHALLDKENKGTSISSTRKRTSLFEEQPLSPIRQNLFDGHLEVIEYFQELVAGQDDRLALEAASRDDVRRLKTMPGFGDLCSLMFFAEVGDVTRFHNARKISGYFGLTSRLYSTSDVRRLGSITKQGSGLMRWMLVQAAWHAVRMSPYFKHKFLQLKARRGKGIAIVAIARMLAEIAFRILRDKTEYDESKLCAATAFGA
jgi:transposase